MYFFSLSLSVTTDWQRLQAQQVLHQSQQLQQLQQQGSQQEQQQQQQQMQQGEEEIAVGGQETEATVNNLMPATQYLVTIYAHNVMGASKPSEVSLSLSLSLIYTSFVSFLLLFA